MKNFTQLTHDFEGHKVWFVSDTHFYHKKLVLTCDEHFERCRTYQTVVEMNDDIVSKWNSMIDNNDIVIFLGDFALSLPHSQLRHEFERLMFDELHGQKLFIRGNHDKALVQKTKDIVVWHDGLTFDYHGKHYICQHEDFNECPISAFLLANDKPNVLVHGHTHEETAVSTYAELDMKQNCVCWEVAYAPISIDNLVEA